jgi:hypothetical protein
MCAWEKGQTANGRSSPQRPWLRAGRLRPNAHLGHAMPIQRPGRTVRLNQLQNQANSWPTGEKEVRSQIGRRKHGDLALARPNESAGERKTSLGVWLTSRLTSTHGRGRIDGGGRGVLGQNAGGGWRTRVDLPEKNDAGPLLLIFYSYIQYSIYILPILYGAWFDRILDGRALAFAIRGGAGDRHSGSSSPLQLTCVSSSFGLWRFVASAQTQTTREPGLRGKRKKNIYLIELYY